MAKETPESELTPDEQPVEVLIEFPDDHPRPVISTTLYVDGAVIDQNTTAPFEHFTWDLRRYTESGSHRLRVEAVDSLGLVGSTIEIPVQVAVQRPKAGLLATISRHGALLAGVTVVVAGALLALVLILGGRIRPRVYGRPASNGRSPGREIPTRPRNDPVTQPVPIRGDSSSKRASWINRLQWPHRHAAPTALAFLTPISDADEAHQASPIPLAAVELTVGRSPAHAMVVLDDPSIEDFHARLRREGGTYRLRDEDSVAGTWVNYAPVPQEGVRLVHSDLVHIGRLGFRFTLRKPAHLRKPVIIREKPSA
jgi:hypothetical protein